MKKIIIPSPTEARRFAYFSSFKGSKRVRWNEYRQHTA